MKERNSRLNSNTLPVASLPRLDVVRAAAESRSEKICDTVVQEMQDSSMGEDVSTGLAKKKSEKRTRDSDQLEF